jgi:hypothetical protein
MKPLDHAHLAAWLRAAHADVAPEYTKGGKPKKAARWWPKAGKAGQGSATTWSWALVLRAANAMTVPEGAHLELSAPWHGHKHREVRERLRDRLWGEAPARTHSKSEVLLDFVVSHYESATYPIVLAAESALAAGSGVGPVTHGRLPEGYARDFYELLLVRAPRRLFVARVGGHVDGDDRSEEARLDALAHSLSEVLGWWVAGLVGDDELGVVLLPESEEAGWAGVRLGVWTEGRLDWRRLAELEKPPETPAIVEETVVVATVVALPEPEAGGDVAAGA